MMMKYLYNPPYIIKKIFPSVHWETRNNKVLLTFDDGPVPETTEIILKKLDDLKIKALFFCVGDNVSKYPQITETITKEGHIIGNHTYNHRNLKSLNKEDVFEQLNSTNKIISSNINQNVRYFRPPYGKFNLSVKKIIENQNLSIVMWSLMTFDYKNDFNIVKNAVQRYLKNNSIIVMHDSLKNKNIILDSIQLIADISYNKNFTFGEPSECLR